MNPQSVVDLRKVSEVKLYWKDQFDNRRRTKPRQPTLNGLPVSDDTVFNSIESQRQKAQRLEACDRWSPVCVLIFTKYHRVLYEGEKALTMWRAWGERVFGQQKKGNT